MSEGTGSGWHGNMIGERADLIARRLAYIEQHGARFLFENRPPPVPGYPRDKNWRLLLPSGAP